MKSNINLESISDGKFYDINDMVRADTGGCEGCSACCHDVGDLVTLTPFDAYQIRSLLNTSLDSLLADKLELVTDNKIGLPHLKMDSISKKCSFLNDKGRCEIHTHRPNICRLFPLARVYEEDDFKYILQQNACVKESLSKIKLKKWIGIENYNENKAFLISWHRLLKALSFRVKFIRDKSELDEVNKCIFTFYTLGSDENESFYSAYYSFLEVAKDKLGIIV